MQISTDEVYGHLAIDRPEGFRLSAELGRSLGRAEAPLAYGTESFSESTPLNPRRRTLHQRLLADMIAPGLCPHVRYACLRDTLQQQLRASSVPLKSLYLL